MNRGRYFKKLEAWKDSFRRKPLILEGARQVGKTWLMREFARKNYKNVVYVRFDKDVLLRKIFERDFDVARIIHELEIAFKTKIDASDSILLFDEIQACKSALTSLKYFCEDRPDLPIIAAGSLLGLTYRDDTSGGDVHAGSGTTGFPVGKVNALSVYPLSFLEFVEALGYESLAEDIRQQHWDVVADFKEVLEDLLRHYYVIGGMPEAVAVYLESKNLQDVHDVHREILMGYRDDFAKHAPKRDVWRIESVWKSLPLQLAKENKKFTYSLIKTGERSAAFREPIAWLLDAGLIYCCPRVSVPRLPLTAYTSPAFKLYALDVGLLATMSNLDSRVILEGSRVFTEFKGALTEQYVYQQLRSEFGIEAFYWSTEDSRTEVDFIFQHNMEIVPIEVKAGENVRSKSLQAYLQRFPTSCAFRFSLLPYIQQTMNEQSSTKLINVPLYGISGFTQRS